MITELKPKVEGQNQQTSKSDQSWRIWLLLALVVALGLFLRTFDLEKIPATAYVDEGINGMEAIRILTNPAYRPIYSGEAQEPAFFFYLIAAVFRVAGVGLLQMKVVTVAASTATIVAVFLLVRRMWGNGEAILAAFFLAVSRWHFGIGRTAFIGSLSPFFDVLTYYLLFRGFQKRSPLSFLAAGISLGLGLNTYYTSRMAPAVAIVLVVIMLLSSREKRQIIKLLFLPAVPAFIVCLPLILFAIGNPGLFFQRYLQINSLSEGSGPFASIIQNVVSYLLMFNFKGDLNGRHNVPGEAMLDPVTGVLFLIGLVLLLVTIRKGRSFFILSWLALSLAPGIFSQDAPHALRTLPVAVIASVIAALGLVTVLRRLPFTRMHWALVLMVAMAATYLNFDTYFVKGASQTWGWFEPRENLVGKYVAAESQSGSSIFLSAPYAGHPTVDFMAWPEKYGRVDGDFGRLLEANPTGAKVVVPTASVPEGLTPIDIPAGVSAVAKKGTLLPNSQPAFLTLDLRKPTGSEDTSKEVNFGNEVSLLDYQLSAENGVVRLSTQWQSKTKMSEELRLSLRLVDKEGFEWGRMDGQLLDDYPTYLWPKDLIVENNHELLPELGTPPGEYSVQLVVYRLPDLMQLAVFDKQGAASSVSLNLGTIGLGQVVQRIEGSSPPAALATFGGKLEMVSQSLKETTVTQGDQIDLSIKWRAKEAPGINLSALIQFTNDSGVAHEEEIEFGNDNAPTSSWRQGDVFLQQARIKVPPNLNPGKYTISVAIQRELDDNKLPAEGKEVLLFPPNSVRLGEVEIKGRPRRFDLPAVAETLNLELGGKARLFGYSVLTDQEPMTKLSDAILSRGDVLSLTLYWQDIERIDASYKVFVHLLDTDGRVMAQHDGFPANGTVQTSSWLEKEVIEDLHEISLPSNLPAGNYKVEVGMYDPTSGQRLGAGNGVDSIILGIVGIK